MLCAHAIPWSWRLLSFNRDGLASLQSRELIGNSPSRMVRLQEPSVTQCAPDSNVKSAQHLCAVVPFQAHPSPRLHSPSTRATLRYDKSITPSRNNASTKSEARQLVSRCVEDRNWESRTRRATHSQLTALRKTTATTLVSTSSTGLRHEHLDHLDRACIKTPGLQIRSASHLLHPDH